MRKALLVVMACTAVALLAMPQAYAACTSPTPMYHAFGWFNCNDSTTTATNVRVPPPSAYSYQLSAPGTTNTGLVDILCEADNQSGGPESCNNPASAGTGDGVVTIVTDWQTPGVIGCPVTTSGTNRVVLVVQAADGTGLIASMNGSDPGFGYTPDMAGSGADASLSCGTANGRPKIASRVVVGSSETLGLTFDTPRVYSDCDPDSLGFAVFGGVCPDAGAGAASVSGVYTSTQPSTLDGTTQVCFAPDPTLTRWTRVATPVAGAATITVTKPASGSCLYIGSTMNIGGFESGAITGFIVYGNPLPASPTAENVGVGRAAGKINVSWETLSEVGLAGFRLVAVGHKGEFEVGSFVAAKGSASKYSATLSISDFKGNKGVKVVSVLTDGTTLSSAVKNF